MAIDVYDCIVLYVSDAMILLMLTAGIAWSIGAIAKRTRHMIVVDATGEQLRAFIWLQLAILLATIETTFASTQASLLTEIGYGVALVVALLLVGLGVRMIIKWSKKGVQAG